MEPYIENEYSTRDLSEAAALIIFHQNLIRLERHGRIVYFIFSDKNRCEEISNQYWFGECLVNAKSYYEAMTTLKHRIFNNS